MSAKNPKTQSAPESETATVPAKRGRKPGKMTPEAKEVAKANRFNKVLTSDEVKTPKAWANVSEDQIRAIIATATVAVETAKADRLAALKAEIAKLEAAPAQV